MKTTLLKFTIILFLFNGIISCNNNRFSGYSFEKELLTNAAQKLKNQPDAALKITDTLLQFNTKDSLKEPDLLSVYQIRQKAFSQLKNSDSVVVTGEKIRAIAAKIPIHLLWQNLCFFLEGASILITFKMLNLMLLLLLLCSKSRIGNMKLLLS